MPLYEYKCDGCGDVFELIQRFSDEPLVTHDKCGGAVHRLISTSALQFKGTGWYITDYAKSGAPSGPSKSEKADTDAQKAESKSDGDSKKPAAETSKPADGGGSKTETNSTPAPVSDK